MSCNDIPSIADLEKTKLRVDHFGELIDGTLSGTSTNPITGKTLKTYPKTIEELGPVILPWTFTTGGTVNSPTEAVLYEANGNYYGYTGALPHVTAPGTDPTQDPTNWSPRTDTITRHAIDLHNHDALAHPELSAAIEADAVRAEAAATAAMMSAEVYPNTAAGLAATPSGQYFSVLSGNVNQYVNLYLNNAGVAVLQKTYPSDKALDDWQRDYPGLFLVAPYYEDSGAGLYFKPTEYLTTGNYIFIRGGYLADAAFTYQKLKDDLAAAGIPANCAIGVTSPLGVTDCIKLGGITTLWYEPTSQVFSWGARARKNYHLKVLEYNENIVAKCQELPLVIDGKHKINSVKADSKTPCQIIPSAGVAPFIPNIDVAAKTLTFYTDTILEAGWSRHIIGATTVIDLTIIASSALIIYYDKISAGFIVRSWNNTLTEVERYNFILVATLRLGATALTTHMSIACPYAVNGKEVVTDVPLSQPVANIFTPLNTAVVGNPKLPEFTTATRMFTLFNGTILQVRDTEWALTSDQSIDVGTGSSATRVWWNTATNTLETGTFASTQTAQQLLDRVLVATIRNVTTAGTAVLSIACPYTVDGKLFGVSQSAGSIIHNPLDANVKGIMHRGGAGLAPENTLPAYKKSAEIFNYYVEGDVRWTSDQIPVLLHDATIDRTSDGTGAIDAMTFAQARTYDFGSWFSPAYAGTLIPSFEEVMRSMKNLGLHGIFEIKTLATTPQINSLLTILNKTGMKGRVQLDCGDFATLQNVVSIAPAQNVGYVVATLSSAAIDQCVLLKTGQNKVVVAADHTTVTEALVQEAHEKGVDVTAWTVNIAADVVTVANKGVDGVITDSLNIAQILRADAGI